MNIHGFLSMEDSLSIILYDDDAIEEPLIRMSFDEFVSMSIDDLMPPHVAREWADKLRAFSRKMDRQQ